MLQLYQALHPEDTEATEEQLTNITINNVFINGMYNDLGFMVRDRLVILAEAQSSWSVNIVVRALMYLSQSWHDYLKATDQLLYSSKKVHLPFPELYVIFTGEREDKPETISLGTEFFGGKEAAVEVKVKMIYKGREGDIIQQYITFTKVCDEQIKKYGRTRKAILETIRICKDRNVLSQYLESKEKEVVDIMMFLYDDDELMRLYKKDIEKEARSKGMREGMREGIREGMREGMREGILEGSKSAALRMLKTGKYALEEIADISGLSIDEVARLEV